jgi:rod shape-determining protein MreD
MWAKYLILIILFYLLAVLQSSFFVHFNLFGAIPNLVLLLFFLATFFSERSNYYETAFYATTAGFFLDIFSPSTFGVSIILLLLLGFFIKKAQDLLKEKNGDCFPIIYFLPLFFITLTVYTFITAGLNLVFIAQVIYNLLLATLSFLVYKKYFIGALNTRQLSLFKR